MISDKDLLEMIKDTLRDANYCIKKIPLIEKSLNDLKEDLEKDRAKLAELTKTYNLIVNVNEDGTYDLDSIEFNNPLSD